MVFTLAMAAILGVRHSVRRRAELQAARARQEQMLTEERIRIARDLHDDLGAGLTQIALLIPQALRNGAAGTAAVPHLERVAKQARELVLALDQIVWAVNPGQDTLEGLAGYLCDFATDLTRDANIRFWPKVPTLLPKVQLTSSTRYNLFIAAKEALNNAARHSGATEVVLRFDFRLDTRELEIEIADNGRGFDPDKATQGNGLVNIRSRLDTCGGKAVIERRPEGGTRVLLTLRIPEDPIATGAAAAEPEEDGLAERSPEITNRPV
jgi:signal transduction histidine kinase